MAPEISHQATLMYWAFLSPRNAPAEEEEAAAVAPLLAATVSKVVGAKDVSVSAPAALHLARIVSNLVEEKHAPANANQVNYLR